jgi:hypothetical protein
MRRNSTGREEFMQVNGGYRYPSGRVAGLLSIISVLIVLVSWRAMGLSFNKTLSLFLALEGAVLLANALTPVGFTPPPGGVLKRVKWFLREGGRGVPVKYNRIMFYGGLICLLFAAGTSFIQNKQEPKVLNVSRALVVLPEAIDANYVINEKGSIQLGYRMKEPYPANGVIDEVSTRLEKSRWTPLKEDYLNPGLLSSHVRGWSRFEIPAKIVHQWIGDWKDEYGNIVRYAFRYTYPKKEKQNLSILTIYAFLTPASLVKLQHYSLEEKNITGKD